MATDKGVAFGDFSDDEVDLLYNDSQAPVQFSPVVSGGSGGSSTGQNTGAFTRGDSSSHASSPEFTFSSKGLSEEYNQEIQFGSSPILSEITPSPLATAVEEDTRAKLLNVNANEFVPSNRSVIKRGEPGSSPSNHGTFLPGHHLSHAPPPYHFYHPYFHPMLDPRYFSHPAAYPYHYFPHAGYRMPFPAMPPHIQGVSPQIAVVAPYRTSGDTRPPVRVSEEKVRGNEYTVQESTKAHYSLSPSSLPSPPSSSVHGDSGIDLGQSKSVSPPSSVPPPESLPVRPSSVNDIHDLSERSTPIVRETTPTDKDTSIRDESTNQTSPTHQAEVATPPHNEIEECTIPSITESTPINRPSCKDTPITDTTSTDLTSELVLEDDSSCNVQHNEEEEPIDQSSNNTPTSKLSTTANEGTQLDIALTLTNEQSTANEKPVQKVAPVNSVVTPSSNKDNKAAPPSNIEPKQKTSNVEKMLKPVQSGADHSTTTPTNKEEPRPISDGQSETQAPPTTKNNGPNEPSQTPPTTLPKNIKSWASIVGNSTPTGPKTQPPLNQSADKKPATVERESKPNEEPHPQFSEEAKARLKQLGDRLKTWSICYDPVSLKPRGLRNSGNLCYIHAPLQALISCPLFYHLFRSLYSALPEDPAPQINTTAVTDAMVKFVSHFHQYPREAMYEEVKNGSKKKRTLVYEDPFWPDFIYEMLVKKNSCLSVKGRQEDAEEFLCWVLSKLHEEMVSALQAVSSKESEEKTKEQPEGGEEEKEEDKGSDEEEWQEVGPRNKSTITRRTSCEESPISKMFGGKLQSTLYRYGMKETVTVEPFFSLQLDIQSSDVHTVKDALEMMCIRESVSLSGDSSEMGAARRITLAELPQCLILHIKRFYFDGTTTHKIHKPVEYDQDLEIPKDLIAASVRGKISHTQRCYKLWAVVCHQGKMVDKGHYICDVFHSATNSWIRVNDNYVKMVPTEFVFNPSRAPNPHVPYLLFYRQSDTMVRRV